MWTQAVWQQRLCATPHAILLLSSPQVPGPSQDTHCGLSGELPSGPLCLNITSLVPQGRLCWAEGRSERV